MKQFKDIIENNADVGIAFKKSDDLLYQKDDLIFNIDDEDKKIYYIEEGRVSLKFDAKTEDSEPMVSGLFVKGQIFGEQILFGEEKRTEIAQADAPNTILKSVSQFEMEELMKTNAFLNKKVRELIGTRLKRAENLVVSILQRNSRDRIIEYLLYLASGKREKVGYETIVRNFHSHKVIGDLTVTSRQTVTTVLNELRTKNFINFNRKYLLIRDIELLEKELSKNKLK